MTIMTQAMNSSPQTLAATPGSDPAAQPVLWMPPQRMRQYHVAKTVGAVLFVALFAGWLVLQWSSPTMRLLAGGLTVVTAWVTATTIVRDIRRSRGRQLAIDRQALTVTQDGRSDVLPLGQLVAGQWRDEPDADAGLTLLDDAGRQVVHLDLAFLADQAEARAFLNWARQHARWQVQVRWPPPPGL